MAESQGETLARPLEPKIEKGKNYYIKLPYITFCCEIIKGEDVLGSKIVEGNSRYPNKAKLSIGTDYVNTTLLANLGKEQLEELITFLIDMASKIENP